ncbi:MAG: LysM peptidoglycan-binding domain-containing protein [Anaerolineae bacterium]
MKPSINLLLVILLTLMLSAEALGAPPAQGPVTHVVQRGESLTSIASRYGVSLVELAQANGLSTRSWVYAGQALYIPRQGGGSAATAPSGGAHVVRAGETLADIASRYGTTVSQLAQANSLPNSDWIYVGQRLIVPGGQGASSTNVGSSAAAGVHIVGAGESLSSIAARYGVSVYDLARTNNLSILSWVYTGQRLVLPGGAAQTTNAGAQQASQPIGSGGVHVVQRGEILAQIASRYGTTAGAIARANNLTNSNIIYVGQRLVIPGKEVSPSAAPPAPAAAQGQMASAETPGERWIDINLSTQTLAAYAGNTLVYTARVSTGLPGTPTVTGSYRIYAKYAAQTMSGPGYYLPSVPHVMYFYRGYALHGAYWHNNFGRPMSHGCVNLPLDAAAWLYQWASVGTLVKVHY